jgi:hypothetical protein
MLRLIKKSAYVIYEWSLSADEYINDISKRKIAHEKLDSLICKAVTISVCRASEPNKNYGYQIINSILAPQPETE